MQQYVSVSRKGGRLLVTTVDENKKTHRYAEDYQPHLYWSSEEGEHKTIFGNPVKKVVFPNLWEMQKALKEYGDIPGALWGMENPVYQYLVEKFGQQKLDPSLLNIAFLDIEVNTVQEIDGELVDGGFPEAAEAKFPITAICQYNTYEGKYFIFTTAKWEREKSELSYRDKVVHVYCRDEKEILQKWLKYVETFPVHVWTGWNCVPFDFPYIVNRLRILFGEREVNRLSGFGIVEERDEKDDFGNNFKAYEIVGSPIIDMEAAYKKYRYKPREKYALGYIMEQEFPDDPTKRKLEFEESIHGELYLKNPQLHTDYCCGDVHCTVELEGVLKFVYLCITLSYMSCVNIGDNFSITKLWDNRVYKDCEQDGVAIPLKKRQMKMDYKGAHVFDVVPGMHKGIVSFDFTSLYPSCWRLLNCGPETLIGDEQREKIMGELLTKAKELDKDLYLALKQEDLEDYFVDKMKFPEWFSEILRKHKVSISPICVFFDVSKVSRLARMIEETFKLRKENKKAKQVWEKRAEQVMERIHQLEAAK